METSCALRVVDGDDIEFAGKRYRLAGFDAPQIAVYRSMIDRDLERTRGYKAAFRLNGLISRADSVYLIPWGKIVSRGRELATLLVDGRDIAICAKYEKWAVDYQLRDTIDWGDPALPFPDIRLPRTLGTILS